MARNPRSLFIVLLLITTAVSIFSITSPAVVPPVQAALAITLNPTSGKSGDVILVSGTGATSAQGTSCSISDNSPGHNVATSTTASVSSGGNLAGSFTVGSAPAAAAGGTYTITVNCPAITPVDSATAQFTVNPAVTLNPPIGVFNQVISFTGFGFRSDASACAVTIADPVKSGSTTCTVTGGTGQVSGQFTVDPLGTLGAHTITITQTSPAPAPPSATPSFQVVSGPTISLDPDGTAGMIVPVGFGTLDGGISVFGGGFNTGSSRPCTISTDPPTTTIATSPAPTCTIDSTGSVTGTFAVSTSAASATYAIKVLDTGPSGLFAETPLVVSDRPLITLGSSSGPAGATVTVTQGAKLFSQRDAGACTITSTPTGLTTSFTCIIDGTGTLTVASDFIVSPNAPGQTYIVNVKPIHGDSSVDVAFIVTPSVTFNPTTGSPAISGGPSGTSVAVSGTGFSPTDTSCSITSTPTNIVSSLVCSVTSSTGALSGSFVVAPGSTNGTYIVTVKGTPASDSAPTVTFFVKPRIILSPSFGSNATNVAVLGSGFVGGVPHTCISFFGLPSLFNNASSICNVYPNGTVSGAFQVTPSSVQGSFIVILRGSSNDLATASFQKGSRSVNLSPNIAVPGILVSVSGTSFSIASSSCTIKPSSLAPIQSCAITLGTGVVTGSFAVGNVAPGLYVVNVTGNQQDSGFAVLQVNKGVIFNFTSTTLSSTTTSTSSTSTTITSTVYSSSISTTTVISTGRSTETDTVYSILTISGQSTASFTVYLSTTSTSTTTSTLFTTVTIYLTLPFTTSGLVLQVGVRNDILLNGIGLLTMLSLIAPFIIRRVTLT